MASPQSYFSFLLLSLPFPLARGTESQGVAVEMESDIIISLRQLNVSGRNMFMPKIQHPSVLCCRYITWAVSRPLVIWTQRDTETQALLHKSEM